MTTLTIDPKDAGKTCNHISVKRRCLDEKVLTREYQGGHTRLRFA